jgi:hypothetical protein
MHVLTEYGLKAGCGDKAKELLAGHTYIFPVKNGQVRCPCCARKGQTLISERFNTPSRMPTPYSQQSSVIPSSRTSGPSATGSGTGSSPPSMGLTTSLRLRRR